MANSLRRRSQFTSKKFRPYALATGQFNLAWNDLHEAFGELFIKAAMGPDAHMATRLRVTIAWGQISSDRTKRDILRVVIQWIGKEEHKAFPKIAADVDWVCTRGNSLEDRRNDLMHSPLGELQNALAAGLMGVAMGEIVPLSMMSSHRAYKLNQATWRRKKPLLPEIRLYRDYASALAVYARELLEAWKGERSSWPAKPTLPPLKVKD